MKVERVPALDKVQRHGLAHDAEADETDVAHVQAPSNLTAEAQRRRE
jgi:hypothetical protein